MWYRFSVLLSVCLITSSFAQKARDYRKEALLLKKTLLQEHLQPRTLDDRFSAQVFDLFIESLDPDKIYFTEAEINTLRAYRTQLDDELNGNGWAFLDHFVPVYKNSLVRAESVVQQILQTPFTSQVMEYFRADTTRWPVSEQELKNKWRMWLKYHAFDRLADMQREPAVASDKDFFSKQEPIARLRVKSFEIRSIRRILDHPAGLESFTASEYLKSIAAVFDPHTTYLPATDMENFLSSLSTEGYYFGVTLDENERGDVMIAALAPGGPAWKSGELHASDILVNLRWEGQEDIDVSGISLEEANEILADANHSTMEFTVRKSGGLVNTVKLQKEKISVEENFVRSYVLVGDVKIGYISLPDFYTRWGDESEGSRCASDVAKEIMKLRKENIDGLILDIRYNGGGSLSEAIALAGIFIDEGAMGILKDRQQNMTVLKDMNRGTVYDGPLLVMVNGQSASASEFLAGVLQDYNRGVIVGNRTYGKATAQNFYPLDPNQKDPTLENIKEGAGFASITNGKFYRVTGKTAQGKGVLPDIRLPDVFSVLNMYESSMPFVLPSDSVFKRTYYKPLLGLPILELRKRSEARQASSPAFQHVVKSCEWLRSTLAREQESVLLQWQDFNKNAQAELQEYAKLKQSLTEASPTYDVVNSNVDHQRMAVDEYAQDFNQRWIKNLKKDIYVEEAFRIMHDLLELKHP